jgi:cytochrome b involved in lipid metabolism
MERKTGMKREYWYLNGKAYDFTNFLERHPGGEWALQLGKGRECLGLYHSYHLRYVYAVHN